MTIYNNKSINQNWKCSNCRNQTNKS